MGFDSNQTPQNTETYLTFVLSVRVTHLWVAPYSEYQEFLFVTINDLREKGWNYRQIADWLNQNDYRTPRGKMFHGFHAYSIVKKKNLRDARLNKKYPPKLSNFALRFMDRTRTNHLNYKDRLSCSNSSRSRSRSASRKLNCSSHPAMGVG